MSEANQKTIIVLVMLIASLLTLLTYVQVKANKEVTAELRALGDDIFNMLDETI